jgi:hypothetical protein
MCPECRDLARALPEERGGSFFSELPGAFRYPLVGGGALMVVVGGLFFAFLDFISALSIFGIVGAFIGAGYLVAYYSRVVSSSADGDRELPDWPEFHNMTDDIIAPFGRAAVVIGVSAGPALAALAYGRPDFAVIFGCVGLLYGPMAWMAVSLHESILAANPVTVVGSITRVPLQYVVASVVFMVVTFGTMLLQEALAATVVGTIGSYIVGLYGMLVAMRVLGLLYYHNEETFDWFGESERLFV